MARTVLTPSSGRRQQERLAGLQERAGFQQGKAGGPSQETWKWTNMMVVVEEKHVSTPHSALQHALLA